MNQQQLMAQIGKLNERISAMSEDQYDMDQAWAETGRDWSWQELPKLEGLERDMEKAIWERDDMLEQYAANSDNPDLHRFQHIRDRKARAAQGRI